MRRKLDHVPAALLGVLAGLLVWLLLLGVQVRRYEPGLWTVRAQRVVSCGVDYNGPPWTKQGVVLWLTCGEESGWRLWPW